MHLLDEVLIDMARMMDLVKDIKVVTDLQWAAVALAVLAVALV
jgi:hypothetical protein